MSNYNNENSWSDKVSGLVTIIALVLVAILSIGLLCALFIQPKEDEQDEQAEVQQISVMDGAGNAMDADTVYAMLEAMSFSAASLLEARAQFNEPSGTTVTSDESVDVRIEAYVRPDDAANKEVDSPCLGERRPRTAASRSRTISPSRPIRTAARRRPYPAKRDSAMIPSSSP